MLSAVPGPNYPHKATHLFAFTPWLPSQPVSQPLKLPGQALVLSHLSSPSLVIPSPLLSEAALGLLLLPAPSGLQVLPASAPALSALCSPWPGWCISIPAAGSPVPAAAAAAA